MNDDDQPADRHPDDGALWLPQRRHEDLRPRPDPFAALEAEQAEARERLAAIERGLTEQAAELARLREALDSQVTAVTEIAPAPPPRNPDARVVELSGQSTPTGRDYWLRRCEGFAVDTASGALGEVEEVRFGRHHDLPDTLVVAVHTGRRRRQSLLVPIEHVDHIAADDGRLTLSIDPLASSRAEQPLASRLRGLARKLRPSTS